MNDPHENLPDELLEDLLQPLRSVQPSDETQSANRKAVRQALATNIRPAWWRQTIAVPVPLAIAASVALMFAVVILVRPSAVLRSSEQPSPISAAEQANPVMRELESVPNEPITPAWTIQRSFIRTLQSSIAAEFVASSPRENRDDS
jgi:hypothetical protein